MNISISNIKTTFFFLLIFTFSVSSCSENYTPKPRGYFRISFPDKSYKKFESAEPYQFEIPEYSFVQKDSSEMSENWWYNLIFPNMKGILHISYKNINNNLTDYIEDSRSLAFKHTIKADAINEELFIDRDKSIYGVLDEIKGNAASPYQFFVTDSTKHFVRGALYFNVHPNKDSLAPVFSFIKTDIIHLIKSVEWKN